MNGNVFGVIVYYEFNVVVVVVVDFGMDVFFIIN